MKDIILRPQKCGQRFLLGPFSFLFGIALYMRIELDSDPKLVAADLSPSGTTTCRYTSMENAHRLN